MRRESSADTGKPEGKEKRERQVQRGSVRHRRQVAVLLSFWKNALKGKIQKKKKRESEKKHKERKGGRFLRRVKIKVVKTR